MSAHLLPDSAPAFLEGQHFRQLHPTREAARRWRFRSLRHTRIKIPGIVPHTISFRDKYEREWLRVDPYGILVAAAYTWNGCTPKRWVPLLGWIGTPDFRCTHLASHVHDALYQFSGTAHFPLHRSDCDAIFRRLIELHGDEEIAAIYHAGVRRFGSWSGRPSNGEHSVIL